MQEERKMRIKHSQTEKKNKTRYSVSAESTSASVRTAVQAGGCAVSMFYKKGTEAVGINRHCQSVSS